MVIGLSPLSEVNKGWATVIQKVGLLSSQIQCLSTIPCYAMILSIIQWWLLVIVMIINRSAVLYVQNLSMCCCQI